MQHLATNIFHTGDSGFPAGNDLDEAKINYVLRKIWENSSGNVDLIVVGGFQKRKINAFCSESRSYGAERHDVHGHGQPVRERLRRLPDRDDAVAAAGRGAVPGFVADQRAAAGRAAASTSSRWPAPATTSAAS